MARINAGSTLANQYAPPFVVSDFVRTGWGLRWNDLILAFEAFDPDEFVVDAGFDTIQRQLFNGVTNQQVFVVPWQVDPTLTQLEQRATLYITINGVKQHTDTFTVESTTNATIITLVPLPIVGPDDVEIIGLQAGNGAFVELENTSGTGVAGQDIPLTWFSPSPQTLIITVNGLRLHTDEYSISSISPFTTTTVTLTFAADLTDAIEIIGITTSGEVPASPVNATNLGIGGFGVFGAKRQVGEEQTLDFKSLVPGTRIAISSDANFITIAADDGYVFGNDATINADPGDRLIGVRNTGAPVTVNLLAIAELPAGDTITIKDESGGAATNNITVTPASETIDGNATHVISTDFGSVTLYSNGTNYFIISGT